MDSLPGKTRRLSLLFPAAAVRAKASGHSEAVGGLSSHLGSGLVTSKIGNSEDDADPRCRACFAPDNRSLSPYCISNSANALSGQTQAARTVVRKFSPRFSARTVHRQHLARRQATEFEIAPVSAASTHRQGSRRLAGFPEPPAGCCGNLMRGRALLFHRRFDR